MKYRLQRVVVLGSGVMGTGIACHLANVGLTVNLLDILPPNLDANEQSKVKRNAIAAGSLKAALKNKPAALYKKDFASKITVGNFEDDLHLVSEADWVIEVIIENLDIKRGLFAKVEQHIKPTTLVSSNTSSIPIGLLAEGRSDNFKKHFVGTHFFNPPRYLPLFEVIPHTETAQEVTDFFMDFGSRILGKETVLCKDTPAFISNRIGVMSTTQLFSLTEKYEMTIEEVDAITGKLIARPNTATYRLQDLVGIDTAAKVGAFVTANVDDEFFSKFKENATPKFMQFLIDNKFLGNKTRKGFYEKTKQRDEKGKSIINALDLKTLEYKPANKPRLAIVGDNKGTEKMDLRFQSLVNGDTREHKFLREYFGSLLAYAANRIPEITEKYYAIDDAMRAGYMWEHGPFETWDLFGYELGKSLIEEAGYTVPNWVTTMYANGTDSFYRWEKGNRQYFCTNHNRWEDLPGAEKSIVLSKMGGTPILKNSEAIVHDLGDGVMCLEFISKSNAIGEGIGNALAEAIQKAEEEGWNGIVIGNNAKNFTVGANLMPVGMMAMQKDFVALDKMVNDFQQLTMLLRTSKIPVVMATQGYVFGGGCEMSMHADAGVYAAESYIGLVEVGVGLIPGGGGTKEMALRASDAYFEGDVQIPTLIEHFKPIATAQVATSAYEAYDLNLLNADKDEVCLKVSDNIAKAKAKVLELAKDYVASTPRTNVKVLGRTGLSTLYTAINEFRLGEYMSDYDVEIARKVAYVICGGDLTGQQKVSEQYLLDIEREAFLSLLGNQKTLDRIQHILMHNKPLRN